MKSGKNTTEILELEGFKVINAENGKEGMLAAHKFSPDIILCDIMMPQMNGYLVLKDLKANPSTAKIPFIYVAASTEKSQEALGMGMGADGYIRKPFDTKELMDTINKCLKK